MKIPTHLKHKPVFVSENYSRLDGQYAHSSDAQGLSLGLAQWNQKGHVDISAKIWRNTGERWSRQSEEMPLHRVLDLALFICKTKNFMARSHPPGSLYDPKNLNIGSIRLQGESMDIEVNAANPELDEDIRLFRDCFEREDGRICERLTRLAEVLKELGFVKS